MHKRNKARLKQQKPHEPNGLEKLLLPPKMRLSKHEWRCAFGEKPRIRPISHFTRWQLQEAKAKFSALFDRAFKEGPQVVTRRNKEAVVILAEEHYRKLTGSDSHPGMLETLLKCPKGPGLKLPERNRENVLDLPSVFE